MDVVGTGTEPVLAVVLKRSLPDVVFLDIQMPGLNGFEFLQALGEQQPLVVFTTAYQQYALKAFEVNSVDYLLKPVERQQLDRALARVERLRTSNSPRPDVSDLLRQLASALQTRQSNYPMRLPSRTDDRVEFIDLGA